jgi:DNA-binding NtrC family response regulator
MTGRGTTLAVILAARHLHRRAIGAKSRCSAAFRVWHAGCYPFPTMRHRGVGPSGSWILVADGRRRSADALARWLSGEGLFTHATARGREALELAQFLPLAAAIVDVHLVDMNGYDLVASLKRVDADLAVVVTTADGSRRSEVRARQLGIAHYAMKPVDVAQLYAVVIKAIADGATRGRRLPKASV